MDGFFIMIYYVCLGPTGDANVAFDQDIDIQNFKIIFVI